MMKNKLFEIILSFLIMYSLITATRGLTFYHGISIPEMFKIPVWVLFFSIFLIFIFPLFGLGISNFFQQRNIFNSKRHILLFSFSMSNVVSYLTMGNNLPLLRGDMISNMFDILFYFSLISLIMLLLTFLMNNLDKDRASEDIDDSEEETTANQIRENINNDDPITSGDDDDLNRRDFAEQLTDHIIKSKGKLTVGIYGPWGSGKSSFINMMRMKVPPTHLTIHFTPWYFGEKSDGVILEFLDHFSEQLKRFDHFDTSLERYLEKYTSFFKSIQVQSFGGVLRAGELLNKTCTNIRNTMNFITFTKSLVSIGNNNGNNKNIK